MNTEAVVYIARKLKWTRAEIGQLSPSQFNELLGELYFQESVDEWRKMHTVATILSAIYNTIPRKKGSQPIKAKDFLNSEMPERHPKQGKTVDQMAEDKGIILPKER
uniref:Uncharacterized protein n=1 Tax=viral metagenome TaxID=1070528 RepID=A0A6M3L1R4_9ZZZZ